jgi:hypothetical protein
MEVLQYIVVTAKVSKELNNNVSTLHCIPGRIIEGVHHNSLNRSPASTFLIMKRIEVFTQKNI